MKKPTISQRAQRTPPSGVRELEPLDQAAQSKGKRVYHVNIGQPDLPSPPEILDAIKEFKQKTIAYAPSKGLPEALLAWSNFYKKRGIQVDSEEIVVTAGGSEGLLFAFMTICDPGDEIIVFEPFYTLYKTIASMSSITLKPIRTYAQNGFHLPSRRDINRIISKKTRGIIICNPNNPTGTLYSESEMRQLAEIVGERNLILISDEPYQDIVFDGKRALPPATIREIEDRLIVVDTVSKRLSACGMRIGCIWSHNIAFVDSFVKFAQSRLSVATLEQIAACKLLPVADTYVEKTRKIYEKRRDIVMKCISGIPDATCVKPLGALYVMPKLPISDADDFARFLLSEFEDDNETVMITPASGFYETKGLGKDEIRIAYVLCEHDMIRAMELLKRAIQKYNKKGVLL